MQDIIHAGSLSIAGLGKHLGVRIIVDLCGLSDFAEGGMLQGALHILGSFPIFGCLSDQEDRERGCLDVLGNVDDLREAWHAQGDILGRHAGKVEGVEGHLRGGLSN